MTEFKTLQFPNTPTGQVQKVKALQHYAANGWRVVSETIVQGKFKGGKACCLFTMCAPLAFLAGQEDGVITITLQKDSEPQQITSQPPPLPASPPPPLPSSGTLLPDTEQCYRIASNGNDLGELTVTTIKMMLSSGELTMQDYYLDENENAWMPLERLSDLN